MKKKRKEKSGKGRRMGLKQREERRGEGEERMEEKK